MPNEIGGLMQAAYGPAGGGNVAGLGALLAGGGAAGRVNAFNRGAYLGGSLQEKLAHASLEREKMLAEQGLQQTYESNGIPHEQAAILAQTFIAGHNPAEISQYREGETNIGMQNRALKNIDTAPPGTTSAAIMEKNNPIMQILSKKPEAVAKVEGGQEFNPFDSDTSFTPTPEAAAQARQHDAAAAASYAEVPLRGAQTKEALAGIPFKAAQTAEANARAAHINDEEYDAAGNPTGEGHGTAKELTRDQIDLAFGGKQEKYLDYLGYMKERNISNPQQGLREWGAIEKAKMAAAAAAVVPAPAPAGIGAMFSNAVDKLNNRGRVGAPGKTIVRTGTDKATGKRVVQYSDGTIEAAP